MATKLFVGDVVEDDVRDVVEDVVEGLIGNRSFVGNKRLKQRHDMFNQ